MMIRPNKHKGCKVNATTKAAEFFSVIGEPTRLAILCALEDQGPLNVSEIGKAVGERMVNVSHHLMILRHSGIVLCEKQGRCRVYLLTAQIPSPKMLVNIGIGLTTDLQRTLQAEYSDN
jgi:DNA-binding transcriptional ArsR family regulator